MKGVNNMQEIKYFFEDYWKIILGVVLGLVVVGGIIMLVTGNDEEEVDTGIITEDNFEGSGDETRAPEEGEAGNNENSEDTGEENTEDEVVDEESGEETGDAEETTEVEDSYEPTEFVEYDEERIEYGEDVDFELSEDLMAVNHGYTNDNLNKVISKYKAEKVIEEGEGFNIINSKYKFLSSNVEGCYGETLDMGECVERLSADLKWVEGTLSDEQEDSLTALGTAISDQEVMIKGLKEEVNKAETDQDELLELIKSYELEMQIRADIYTMLREFSNATDEERENNSYKVSTSLSHLVELEEFNENYMAQRVK